MKRLTLIIALISVTIMATGQDLRKVYTMGPVREGNNLDHETYPLFEGPQDNFNLFGFGYFASDSVEIDFKHKRRERMNQFYMKVDSVDAALEMQDPHINVITFWFYPNTEFTPYKAELFFTDIEWRLWLFFEDQLFYFVGEVL